MKRTAFIFLAWVLLPAAAWALDGKINGEPVSESKWMADTIWTVLTAVLVFFMQAGFAMVEGGFCRAKNTVNLMMKNLLDFSTSSIVFWVIGFGLMFGNGNDFIGLTGFFVRPDSADQYQALSWTSVPTMAAWFFQLVFAGTAATIVSGAVAERIKFSAYLIYSAFISAIAYPIIGHWIWGGGWLAKMGMLDFAGSTVVHTVGGCFAFAGALMLGPRIGKYSRDGKVHPIAGHSMPLAALGTFILWVGWFGFNPGSTMGADVMGLSRTAVTTNLAAATGAVAGLITSWLKFGKPDIGMALNGCLAGLVAITAPCFFVSPAGAALIGVVAGILVVYSVVMLDGMQIDDPVGAISVHMVCGIMGTIMVGVFHLQQGVLYHPQDPAAWRFLGVQFLGSASTVAACLGMGFALFGAIKATVGLRVSANVELDGLDVHEHGARGYPDFVIAGAPVTSQSVTAPQPDPVRAPMPAVAPSSARSIPAPVGATAPPRPAAGMRFPPPKLPASMMRPPSAGGVSMKGMPPNMAAPPRPPSASPIATAVALSKAGQAKQKASSIIEEIARHPELASMDQSRQESYLRGVLGHYPFFELFYVTDASGTQITRNISTSGFKAAYGSNGVGMNWSKRPWYLEAVRRLGTYVSDIYRSAASDSHCFTIAHPIRGDSGQVVGVLGADINLADMLTF